MKYQQEDDIGQGGHVGENDQAWGPMEISMQTLGVLVNSWKRRQKDPWRWA